MELYAEERGIGIESIERRREVETQEPATQIELVIRPLTHTEEAAPKLTFPIPLPGNLGHGSGSRASTSTDEQYGAGPYIEGGSGAVGMAMKPTRVGRGVTGGRKLKMSRIKAAGKTVKVPK